MSQRSRANVTRRGVLKSAAAAGVMATAASTLGTAQAADATVRVYGVSTSTLKAGWDDFTAQTGLTMEYTETTADLGVFIREVVANEVGEVYDFFIIDIGMQRKLGPEGYFLKVDVNHPELTNWKTVEEGYKGSIMVDEGGTQVPYGIPNMFNADSFGFWPEDLGVKPRDVLDWSYMFESDKTLGRSGVDTSWAQSMTHIAMYVKATGKAQIKDNTDLTAEEAKTVMDWAIERKKAGQFRTFFSGWDEQVHLLGSQEVSCLNCWEPAVREVNNQKGADVVFYAFADFYFKWGNAIFIAKQAAERGNLDNVYKAINYFLGGEYRAQQARDRGYGGPNMHLAVKHAEDSGWAKADIDGIRHTSTKINRKYESEHFWTNPVPKNVDVMEEEWERFLNA